MKLNFSFGNKNWCKFYWQTFLMEHKINRDMSCHFISLTAGQRPWNFAANKFGQRTKTLSSFPVHCSHGLFSEFFSLVKGAKKVEMRFELKEPLNVLHGAVWEAMPGRPHGESRLVISNNYPDRAHIHQGSHFSGLTKFPDFSSIFSHFSSIFSSDSFFN